MSEVYKDRVAQTSTTTGTGAYSLSGSVSAFRDFDEVGNGNQCYYLAVMGTGWEVGLGTVTVGSPNTLSRDSVLSSSNSDAAVSWGAGTKTVSVILPADVMEGFISLLPTADETAGGSTPTARREVGNVHRYGAVGDGVTDDTAAIQAAFDAIGSHGEVIFKPLAYACGAITLSSKTGIVVHGNGATIVEDSPANVALWSFTSCHRARIFDLHFEGSEDNTYFQANSPTEFRSSIKFTTSHRVRVKDVTGEAKRGLVTLDECNNGIVEGADLVGFFQDAGDGTQSNSNYCAAVRFDGGRHNKAVSCHAENTGSVVLWGSDGVGHSALNCTGLNLHDNGIYGSSGTRGRVIGCDFGEVHGQGVKVRGSQNIVFGNSVNAVYGTSAGFGMTGNGVTPDAYGANGHGNILVANSVEGALEGVGARSQDGLYQRDGIIAFNTMEDITGPGGYGGIRARMEQNGIYAFNTMNKIGADYGLLLSSTALLGNQKTMVVFGNAIADFNGGEQGIRVNYAEQSLFGGNVGTDTANLIQARNVEDSVFIGNVDPDGTTVLSATSANSNTGNVAVGNRGTSSLHTSSAVQAGNLPSGTQHLISATPTAVGLVTVISGVAYVSVGTSSSADWKQIDN